LDFLENLKRIKIADYKAHPKNPNGHPVDQLGQLGQSLKDYGQYKNVVVWQDYFLAGHGLVAAAQQRGLTELVAVDVSHLSEADALGLMAADNRLAETGHRTANKPGRGPARNVGRGARPIVAIGPAPPYLRRLHRLSGGGSVDGRGEGGYCLYISPL